MSLWVYEFMSFWVLPSGKELEAGKGPMLLFKVLQQSASGENGMAHIFFKVSFSKTILCLSLDVYGTEAWQRKHLTAVPLATILNLAKNQNNLKLSHFSLIPTWSGLSGSLELMSMTWKAKTWASIEHFVSHFKWMKDIWKITANPITLHQLLFFSEDLRKKK